MAGFSFGGSKSSTKASTTTNTTVKKFDEQSKMVLDQLMQYLQGGLPNAGADFSRNNAIADSQNIVKSIFDQYKQTALPQIAMGMQGAGVYNATAGQSLANDAFGKATANASQAVLDNIIKYAGLKQQDQSLTLNGLLNTLQLQRDAYSNTVETSTGKSSTGSVGFGISL